MFGMLSHQDTTLLFCYFDMNQFMCFPLNTDQEAVIIRHVFNL